VLFSLLLGCSVTKIYQESPPSTDALSGINYIYIYQFSGEKSILFEKILNHEIQKHSYFKNLQILPDYSRNDSAILTVEVTRYYAKDIEEILKQKEVKLVEKEISNKDYSMSNKLIKEFDFVEKVFDERVIHRTLDLEFSFKLTNVEKNKILYFKKENASLKLSYFGGESILLIPDSNDEMARLSQLLIQKFLNKINPKPKEIVIELEKGTNPLPWTFGLVDFGHPRIIRSNYYATGKKYKLALKGWNYVLFEPKNFPKSELFFFNNNVFLRLKKANIPHSILQKLFSIRGKSFNLNEINIILLGLISSNEFETYSKIIKYHARFDQKKDRINLASAHYNLGSIYQIQNEFELAAYHFAKANAYNPQEKYSQSWIEIQHLMGKYNPRDDSVRSIESFLKPPPGSTLFKPKN
tara:strand:+ start:313 stop:1545 length:1233 start_codon:yes stop_codon:yes gene_type:complete